MDIDRELGSDPDDGVQLLSHTHACACVCVRPRSNGS